MANSVSHRFQEEVFFFSVAFQFGCKRNKELRLKANGGRRGVLLRARGKMWIGHVLYDQLDAQGSVTSLEETSKGEIWTEYFI